LRDAEKWDTSPLVGPNLFLSPPNQTAVAEATRELTGIARREITEGPGLEWTAVIEAELERARAIQSDEPGLKSREIEQAVCAVFLSSQPIGRKALTPDLLALLGATRPDRIGLGKGLRRWTQVSWFLDETEFVAGPTQPDALPKAWRLGNRPNLTQMHDDACRSRVTDQMVEATLLGEVKRTRSLTLGASAAGARLHTLPVKPQMSRMTATSTL
jgi:hypothetical protein